MPGKQASRNAAKNAPKTSSAIRFDEEKPTTLAGRILSWDEPGLTFATLAGMNAAVLFVLPNTPVQSLIESTACGPLRFVINDVAIEGFAGTVVSLASAVVIPAFLVGAVLALENRSHKITGVRRDPMHRLLSKLVSQGTDLWELVRSTAINESIDCYNTCGAKVSEAYGLACERTLELVEKVQSNEKLQKALTLLSEKAVEAKARVLAMECVQTKVLPKVELAINKTQESKDAACVELQSLQERACTVFNESSDQVKALTEAVVAHLRQHAETSKRVLMWEDAQLSALVMGAIKFSLVLLLPVTLDSLSGMVMLMLSGSMHYFVLVCMLMVVNACIIGRCFLDSRTEEKVCEQLTRIVGSAKTFVMGEYEKMPSQEKALDVVSTKIEELTVLKKQASPQVVAEMSRLVDLSQASLLKIVEIKYKVIPHVEMLQTKAMPHVEALKTQSLAHFEGMKLKAQPQLDKISANEHVIKAVAMYSEIRELAAPYVASLSVRVGQIMAESKPLIDEVKALAASSIDVIKMELNGESSTYDLVAVVEESGEGVEIKSEIQPISAQSDAHDDIKEECESETQSTTVDPAEESVSVDAVCDKIVLDQEWEKVESHSVKAEIVAATVVDEAVKNLSEDEN